MKERGYHPELNFMKKELAGFLARDLLLFGKITLSVFREKYRNFSDDIDEISKLFETPILSGLENIPIKDRSPLIIVCNHPDIHDQLLGTIFLTKAFADLRRQAGLPGNIHWFMASNAPRREAAGKLDMIGLKALDWIQHDITEKLESAISGLMEQKKTAI